MTLAVQPRFALVAASMASLAAPGCVIRDDVTSLQVADASRVALSGPAPTASGAPPGALPADRQPRDVVLGEGSFAPEPGALASYRLHAVRRDAGGIGLAWETHAPILNGEQRTLIGADGAATWGGDAVGPPAPAERATLRVSACAGLRRATVRGTAVGYRAGEWMGCEGPASVPYVLETPWSNVVSYVRTREPMRWLALGLLLLDAVVMGVPGSLLLALPTCKNGSSACDGTAQHAVGWTFIGVGAAIGALLLPTLLAPTEETSYVPAAAR